MRRFPSSWNTTLAQLGFRKKRRRNSAKRGRQSWLESLEARQMLTVTVGSQQDTYIDEGLPTDSFGTLPTANVGENSGNRQEAFFEFDLSSLSGQEVTSATVTLPVDSVAEAGVENSADLVVSDWDESLTWDDRGSLEFGPQLGSGFNPVGGSEVDIDVTATVERLLKFGDMNLNGTIDAAGASGDVEAFYQAIFDPAGYQSQFGQAVTAPDVIAAGDANFDGVIDTDDVSAFFERTGIPAGDYDLSGVVDANDYDDWASNFGATNTRAGDGNFDGIVSAADYVIFRDRVGSSATPEAPTLSIRVTDTSAGGGDRTTVYGTRENGNPSLNPFLTVDQPVGNLPPEVDRQNFSVDENSPVGTNVGTVTAADPDGTVVSLAITKGNTNDTFEINPATGLIRVADPLLLDADNANQFLLEVTATDNLGATSSELVLINVNDLNETPIAPPAQTVEISELAQDGDAVATVGGEDPEGVPLVYGLNALTNPGGVFAIDPVTGQITVSDASGLVGDTTVNLQATLTDGVTAAQAAFVTVNIAEAPAVTPVVFTTADYNVSHRKKLSFNPAAGFENSLGSDFRVTVETSGGGSFVAAGGSVNLGLGVLTVNADPSADLDGDGKADGVFTFDPNDNLQNAGLLSPEASATGVSRYSAIEEDIEWFVIDTTDDSVLASGMVDIKVTNDLPVFRGELRSDDETGFFLVDTTITVHNDATYRVNVEDYFYDPDGDRISVVELQHESTSLPSDPSFIQDIVGESPFGSNRFLRFEKKTDQIVDISHNLRGGSNPDDIEFSLRSYDIVVTDGQENASGNDVTHDLRLRVGPGQRFGTPTPVPQFDEDLSPWVTVIEEDNGVPLGSVDSVIDETVWSLDAVARQPSRAGRDLQVVGDAVVDLNTGQLVRTHELLLDGSGGAAEFSLPGLVYDSSTVDPQPVISGVLERQAGQPRPILIEATLKWIDHVNDDNDVPVETTVTFGDGFNPIGSTTDEAYAFTLTPGKIPIASGVYHWELEVAVTFDNFNDFIDFEELVVFSTRGESAVVVEQEVSPSDFGSFSEVLTDRQPVFGEGWRLGGVPALFIDDRGDDFNFDNDRLIVSFPGEAPRVFQPGPDNIGFSFDARDYDNGEFVPISVGSEFEDPTEWGTLVARNDAGSQTAGEIVYTTADGVEYVFRRFADFTLGGFADYDEWLLDRIQVPGQPSTQFERVTSSADPNFGRLEAIIGTDGGRTEFVYDANGYVDRLDLATGGDVEFTVDADGRLEQTEQVQAAGPPTIPNRIRRFSYDNFGNAANADTTDDLFRLTVDEWYGGSVAPANLERVTSFDWDTSGLITEVVVGRDLTDGADTSPSIDYSIQAVSSQAILDPSNLPALPPTPTPAIATVERAVGDLESFTEAGGGPTNQGSSTAGGGTYITEYEFTDPFTARPDNAGLNYFDNFGRIIRQEEFFEPTGGSRTSIATERREYDQLGSVRSLTDALGRETTFRYDYDLLPTYADASGDLAGTNDTTPAYDPTDYRGNVIEIAGFNGVARFEYETDNERLAAVGSLVREIDVRGVETTYDRDTSRRLTQLSIARAGADDYVESFQYADLLGTGFEVLSQSTNPLGLTTTYTYYDSRQVESITVTDAGTGSDAGTGETTHTRFVYDENAVTGLGFVDTITEHAGADASAPVFSVTDLDFDETGLVRRSQIKDSGGDLLFEEQYEYDADGLRTALVDGNGVRSEFEYDARGLLMMTTAAVGLAFTSNYAGSKSIQQQTAFQYYADGTLKQTTLADGTTVERFFDPIARSEWTRTSGVAGVTTITTDGNPTTPDGVSTQDLFEVARTDFDVLGRAIATENLLTGAETALEYTDLRNNLPTKITEQVNLGLVSDQGERQGESTVEFVYDQLGNTVREDASSLAAVTRAYDELGYLTSTEVESTRGGVVDFVTDALGNVTQRTEFRRTVTNPDLSGPSAVSTTTEVTEFRYDQQGRLRRVGDAEAADRSASSGLGITEIDYAFETLDIDPDDGQANSRTYRRIDRTDRDGLASQQLVDAAGQTVRETSPLGGVSRFFYDTVGNTSASEFRPAAGDTLPGRRTEFTYDGLNRLRETEFVDTVSGSSIDSRFTYVDYFLPIDTAAEWDVVTTDEAGSATRFRYDSLDNLVASQAADPGASPSGVTLANDAPTSLVSYSYDPDSRAVGVTSRTTVGAETGPTDTLRVLPEYDDTRVSRQVVTTQGNVILRADRLTNLNATDATVDLGDYLDAGFVARSRSLYDTAGRQTFVWDSNLQKTSFNYDDSQSGTGEVFQITNPNGEATFFTYDSAGNRSFQEDTATDERIAFVFDGLNRLSSETITIDTFDAGGNVNGSADVSRTWSYNGLATTYTDRNGRAVTTTLNPSARTRTEQTSYDGLTYSATFNLHSDGSLRSATDAWTGTEGTLNRTGDGSTVEYAYDVFGRPTQITTGFEFADAVAPRVRQTLGYYDTGIRQSSAWSFDATNDAVDNFADVQTTSYSVDNLSRVTGIGQTLLSSVWAGGLVPNDRSIEVAYNADGTRASLTRYDDNTFTNRVSFSEYAYDEDGRLGQIAHRRDDNFLVSLYDSTFDENGRLATQETRLLSSDSVPTVLYRTNQAYRYDSAGQLTQIGIPNPDTADPLDFEFTDFNAFNHDDSGNRTNSSETLIGRNNRLLREDGFVYSYDDEGNLIEKREITTGDKTVYEWDHRGRLLSAEDRTSADVVLDRVDYLYDALGRRVAKKTATDHTGYAFDGANVQFEIDLDSGGVIDRNYLYGPGVNEAVAVDQQGVTVWNFADAVGTVRTTGVVDNNGDWSLLHRNLDSNGNQLDFRVDNETTVAALGDTGFAPLAAAPVIFAGHQFDADLGLYDMQARYKDPTTGRFLNEDPRQSDTNSYRYAVNDPNNFVDPDGEAIFTTAAVLTALTYAGTQALFAIAETGIEGAAVSTLGSQQDAENFSYVNSFGKNFAINLATGGIGGKVKVGSTLGRVSLQVGLFAGRQGIEIGGDTAFDVYVNNRDFQTSLLVNTAGSLLGETGGRAIGVGFRSFRRNFEVSLDSSGVFLGSGLGGAGGLRIQRRAQSFDDAVQADLIETAGISVRSIPSDRAAQLAQNIAAGERRTLEEISELQRRFPGASILTERNLLDATGRQVLDPITGQGRRLDLVVVDRQSVIDVVEVTGINVSKFEQLTREARIRLAGGNFIRDPGSGLILPLNDLANRVSRRI